MYVDADTRTFLGNVLLILLLVVVVVIFGRLSGDRD